MIIDFYKKPLMFIHLAIRVCVCQGNMISMIIRDRYQGHGLIITSYNFLWDVIIYTYHGYVITIHLILYGVITYLYAHECNTFHMYMLPYISPA